MTITMTGAQEVTAGLVIVALALWVGKRRTPLRRCHREPPAGARTPRRVRQAVEMVILEGADEVRRHAAPAKKRAFMEEGGRRKQGSPPSAYGAESVASSGRQAEQHPLQDVLRKPIPQRTIHILAAAATARAAAASVLQSVKPPLQDVQLQLRNPIPFSIFLPSPSGSYSSLRHSSGLLEVLGWMNVKVCPLSRAT